MDTVDVHGVTYVKSGIAAREVGYTPDYVGQLCRKGAIDATLVGRTWYVREGALATHKKRKPRHNPQKTSEDIEAQIEKAEYERGRIHTSVYVPGVTPEYRKRLIETPIRYESSDGELIPTPQKSATLSKEEAEDNDVTPVEKQDAPKTTEEDSSENDSNDAEEVAVPVVRLDEKRANVETDDTTVVEESDDSELKEEPAMEQNHAHASPLLPIMLGIFGAVVFSASLFLEGMWAYSRTNDPETLISTTRFQTSFGVASLGEVLDEIKKAEIKL